MRLAALSILHLAGLALCQDYKIQIPITESMLNQIPRLGFGTWRLDRSNASEVVSTAITTGYRHIDCAAAYGNEKEVGKGIEDGMSKAGLSRSELWITSKLWNDHHAPERVESGIDQTLSDLGLEYLDLYHMHWPVATLPSGKNAIYFLKTWDEMVKLVEKGKARYIGVSNFDPKQLEELMNHTDHPPSVHQMELHPYLQQNDWINYHKALGIHVTAYSPFGGTNPIYDDKNALADRPPPLLNNTLMKEIAEKRGCSPAQVSLAWGISRGTSVIPKSQHENHIRENFAATNCKLRDGDLRAIDKLGDKYTFRYNNPSKSWGVPLYEGLDGT